MVVTTSAFCYGIEILESIPLSKKKLDQDSYMVIRVVKRPVFHFCGYVVIRGPAHGSWFQTYLYKFVWTESIVFSELVTD